MLVSYSHRFIFIHVGKTGGMSMREVLAPFSVEPEKFKMRRPPRMNGGHPNPMHAVWETLLLHAKAKDVQKELPADVFNSFYKFAFVRNPWDLQVSLYHFMLRDPAIPRHDEVKALGSFDAFIEWVIATHDPFPRGITKFQADMISDSSGKVLVDFIGHYETLAEDYSQVCARLGLDAPLPHLNRSAHRDYSSYYNDHTRGLVGEHFRRDVELFDYSFDGYMGKR